jgi:hypothetical protein
MFVPATQKHLESGRTFLFYVLYMPPHRKKGGELRWQWSFDLNLVAGQDNAGDPSQGFRRSNPAPGLAGYG